MNIKYSDEMQMNFVNTDEGILYVKLTDKLIEYYLVGNKNSYGALALIGDSFEQYGGSMESIFIYTINNLELNVI